MTSILNILLLISCVSAKNAQPETYEELLKEHKMLQRQFQVKSDQADDLEIRLESCKEDNADKTEDEKKYETNLTELMDNMEKLTLYITKLKAQIGENDNHIKTLKDALVKAGLPVPKLDEKEKAAKVKNCPDQVLDLQKEYWEHRKHCTTVEEAFKVCNETTRLCITKLDERIKEAEEMKLKEIEKLHDSGRQDVSSQADKSESKDVSCGDVSSALSTCQNELEQRKACYKSLQTCQTSYDNLKAREDTFPECDEERKKFQGSMLTCQKQSKQTNEDMAYCNAERDHLKMQSSALQQILETVEGDKSKGGEKEKVLEQKIQQIKQDEEAWQLYFGFCATILLTIITTSAVRYVASRWRQHNEEQKQTKQSKKLEKKKK